VQESVLSWRFTVEQEPFTHRILAFGDSLTKGSPTNYGGYPYYLDQFLDKEKGSSLVTNAGLAGETTAGGLKRFESYLTKWNDIQYVYRRVARTMFWAIEGILFHSR